MEKEDYKLHKEVEHLVNSIEFSNGKNKAPDEFKIINKANETYKKENKAIYEINVNSVQTMLREAFIDGARYYRDNIGKK